MSHAGVALTRIGKTIGAEIPKAPEISLGSGGNGGQNQRNVVPSEPGAVAKAFVVYLAENKAGNSDLEALWENQLGKLEGIQDFENWTSPKFIDLYGKNEFVWMVIKLWILNSGGDLGGNREFLNDMISWTPTKTMLRRTNFDSQSDETKMMLGALACEIEYLTRNGRKYTSYNKPGVTPTVRDRDTGEYANSEFLFLPGRACGDLTTADAIPGLRSLLAKIQEGWVLE